MRSSLLDLTLRFTWDLDELAAALKIGREDVALYFRDGRRISFILERRFRDAHQGWRLAPSEGAGYDLVDEAGRCWEVRSVSKNIYFCPSYMVGSGRRFEERGFFEKLDSIGGYLCSDITLFPDVPVFVVPSPLIRKLYDAGKLGPSTSISRDRFYSLIVPALKAVEAEEGARPRPVNPDQQ
jgi:hypothetical protein